MAVYFGRSPSVSYTLGRRLGGGGEGEVYEIAGKPDLVAKVYFESKFTPTAESPNPRQTQKEKIETMLDQPVSSYINGVLSVAWPQDLLIDQQGRFSGYTMPRVNSQHHIFAACRERERVQLYPSYTWKTAILIAYNLALAVKTIHRTNAVVGDMNPNNIMLDEKGHVTLIDTDSFNITNKKTGKVYKCSVGVPETLPPELQGKNLAKPTSVFTKQTDSFALSIHIFNLLMNNCHPFGCVGLNKSQSSSSSNPVVHNIVKGNCPYVTSGSGATSPDAPDIMMLPKEIRQLFDRAFSYSSATAVLPSTISRRPSAEEWQIALGELYQTKMTECRKAMPHLHLYPSTYSKCPWCAIKQLPAPVYAGAAAAQQTTTATSYGSTGRRISRSAAITRTSSGSAGTSPARTRNRGASIRRESWPLWATCILAGLISAPFMVPLLVTVCDQSLDYALSSPAAYVILTIVGAIAGCAVAYYGQESYQKAYNAWPWLLLGLLVPLATALIVAAVMLVIFLVVLVVSIVIAIIGTVIAIACLCGMLSGG